VKGESKREKYNDNDLVVLLPRRIITLQKKTYCRHKTIYEIAISQLDTTEAAGLWKSE
jgi:hypothetical protein